MSNILPGPAPRAQRADWVRCPQCRFLTYGKRLARNLGVCPECGHHGRLSARERLAQLIDAGSFVDAADHDGGQEDPLAFADRLPYRQRLAEARRATGEQEAVVTGRAAIGGSDVVVAVMDFRFLGGSMGTGVGERVTWAAEEAARTRIPLLLVTTSGGARMQEGCLSLMQMAKTAQAIGRLRELGVLCVCVLPDPTFGGVSASFAMLGHVVIAEAGALVGFAGPRVIQETIRQELPPGFQTAEFLLAHGLVDRVEPRQRLRPVLEQLLATTRRGDAPPEAGGSPPIRVAGQLPASGADPWALVQRARHIDRPTTLDYLGTAFDEFVELHGDRAFADDAAIVGGLARIGGRGVVVVGHQKGHNTRDLVARNFGMAHPEGYRKARRLLEIAASLRLPVVCLVDTPGAFPGVQAEERGQSAAIAECIMTASRLPVPVVSVITGEGGSGGALALATADRVLMLENAFYSVISPEGCAAILWRSRDAAPDAARALRITAPQLLDLGVVDAVVPEPAEGAHTAPRETAANLRSGVLEQLDDLDGLPAEALLAHRYERFRAFGGWPSAADLAEQVRSA
jgi:acetyl-CoA carboxylase carboxyl transferase alpha subunit/acetyl-CoA carboxylase carboxyl transferase beta subunit